MSNGVYIRNCPKCGNELSYTTKWRVSEAEELNRICYSCARLGRRPFFGKRHSKMSRRKMRISAVNRIKRDGISRIGKNEKQLLDKQEKRDGVKIIRQWNTSIGYIVDGYCPKTNTIYEVYERKHLKTIEHDERRKKEIINKFGCRFIEIKEWK